MYIEGSIENMAKVKDIVKQLNEEAYKSIEQSLVKNKAENLLFLFKSYKETELNDDEIIKNLDLNSNSFYVLKSRLHDKIENYFSKNLYSDKEAIAKQLQQIPVICFNTPREVAVVFLKKLEKDLLELDMHNELLIVYSAFKKLFLYSDKYFYYSQLYNKQVAYDLSLEKSEEILERFNQSLSRYNFSRLDTVQEELVFLEKEILGHYALNPSRQIEIVKNLIQIQSYLFCNTSLNNEYDIEEGFRSTIKAFNELPETSLRKSWSIVLNYLYFEYYKKSGQAKSISTYYEKVNASGTSILLYNSICNTPRFLLSKVRFLGEQNRIDELINEAENLILIDPEDVYSEILYNVYKAMQYYYSGKIKDAINLLNETINYNSFKDNFHINMEVKLTLAFFYIQIKEFDVADSILKSIYRKIKTDSMEMYANALELIKVFGVDVSQKENTKTVKQKDTFMLFLAKNNDKSELLGHLQPELKKKYL